MDYMDEDKREEYTREDEINPPDEDDRQKRRRLTYHQQKSSQSQTSAFLDFHLQALKSFESSDQESDNVVDENALQNVPSIMWAMTNSFLVQRSELEKAKKEAARWRRIHEEAFSIMRATRESSKPDETVKTPPHHHQQPSPTLQQHTTSPSMSQSKKHSFSIVARLLERRHNAVDHDFQQRTDPFQPLLTFSKNRIETLKDSLRVQQEAWHDDNQKKISELLNVYPVKSSPSPSRADPSQMAAMQSKIRLWTMLTTDLESVVS